MGAFGLRAAGEGARDAAPLSDVVVRSRLPDLARLERQGGAGLARGLPRIPRPFRGRYRHVYARTLALRRRACALVAPVAQRPAAGRRAQNRLRERRPPIRRRPMRLLAALITLLIA